MDNMPQCRRLDARSPQPTRFHEKKPKRTTATTNESAKSTSSQPISYLPTYCMYAVSEEMHAPRKKVASANGHRIFKRQVRTLSEYGPRVPYTGTMYVLRKGYL